MAFMKGLKNPLFIQLADYLRAVLQFTLIHSGINLSELQTDSSSPHSNMVVVVFYQHVLRDANKLEEAVGAHHR